MLTPVKPEESTTVQLAVVPVSKPPFTTIFCAFREEANPSNPRAPAIEVARIRRRTEDFGTEGREEWEWKFIVG